MKFHVTDIPAGAVRIGRLNSDRSLDLTVVLAQKKPLPPIHHTTEVQPTSGHSATSCFRGMTHAQLAEAHGASTKSAQMVKTFAAHYGLTVTEVAIDRRTIRLSGKVPNVEHAFKTTLFEFDCKGHRFFAPSGPVEIPEDWQGTADIVLGLHSSPYSHPRRTSSLRSLAPTSTVRDLARAYRFPEHLNAKGQTIGLIEFGGGFHLEDIERFCHQIRVPVPRISVVRVGDGANRPAGRTALMELIDLLDGSLTLAAGEENSDSFEAAQSTAEVTMDLEILAALAPAAHIVVYFAPADEQGLYHALSHAVHDEHNKPDVLSISWSFPEHSASKTKIDAIERVLLAAAHLGITICASTGDAGAMNGATDGLPSVNYPASSPHCLACGGTSGRISSSDIDQEVVWNATHFGVHGASGGGVSTHFHPPVWQQDAQVPDGPSGTPGRGIPDVAGLADPRHGCEIQLIGHTIASAGTSAVAPLWAALIARINQALGQRVGHLHPHLYAAGKNRHAGLRPVVKGDNGYYHARNGWNPCAGYGTPRGDALLQYLQSRMSNPS